MNLKFKKLIAAIALTPFLAFGTSIPDVAIGFGTAAAAAVLGTVTAIVGAPIILTAGIAALGMGALGMGISGLDFSDYDEQTNPSKPTQSNSPSNPMTIDLAPPATMTVQASDDASNPIRPKVAYCAYDICAPSREAFTRIAFAKWAAGYKSTKLNNAPCHAETNSYHNFSISGTQIKGFRDDCNSNPRITETVEFDSAGINSSNQCPDGYIERVGLGDCGVGKSPDKPPVYRDTDGKLKDNPYSSAPNKPTISADGKTVKSTSSNGNTTAIKSNDDGSVDIVQTAKTSTGDCAQVWRGSPSGDSSNNVNSSSIKITNSEVYCNSSGADDFVSSNPGTTKGTTTPGTGTGGTGTNGADGKDGKDGLACGVDGKPLCKMDFGGVGDSPTVGTADTSGFADLWSGNGAFNSLLSWRLPAHSNECPVIQFDVFDQHYQTDSHCVLYQQVESTISVMFKLLFTIGALFIVLAA